MFHSESTFYICLKFKELLPRKRSNIWKLSECNATWIHNHLVQKPTLNYLAQLTKWLSWVESTYMYGPFDCMFLSCHVRVPESIHTISFPGCQGTSCSKQARYLMLSVRNQTQTHNHLVHKQKINHLAKLTIWLSWVESTYLYSAFDCIFLSCHVRVSEWIQTLYFPKIQELLAQNKHNIWNLIDCNGTRTRKH